MENDIIIKENAEENLMKLAAQRQLYSNAKKFMGIQVILNVPIAILLALLPIFIFDTDLTIVNLEREILNVYIFTYGVGVAILDLLVISNSIRKTKEKAACIQEDFDCKVLSLQWNDIKSDKPDGEDIIRFARQYKKSGKELTDMKNWYMPETIGTLPLPIGRIICQRTNCWWDSNLRKKFRRDTLMLTTILFILLFLISLVRGITIPKFLTNVFGPFLPALIFSIRQRQQNNKIIECLDRLKSKAVQYWNMVPLNPNDYSLLNNLSRSLQDEIWECRKNSPLIFDWYYERYKSSQQMDINYTAEEMINTYNIIRNNNV